MPRNKIDVQQIDFSEVVSQNVSVSGSLTVDGSTKVNSNSLVNQKAIQLDGTSPFDEVTISDATTDTSFSSGGGTDKAFTISMWVNLEEIDYDGTNGKHAGALYTKRSTSPNNGEIYIGVGSGRLTFILYADPDENGVGSFSTSNRLVVAQSSGNFQFFHAENTWFHLCITYDGTEALTGVRIYKNSHPVGTGDILEGGGQSTTNTDLNVPNLVFFGTMAVTNYSGTPQTSIPTTLGGIDVSDSSANALAGKLADVCRFNRVLTHTEVQELYNDGNVKNMEEHSAYSDLVHWWKMGDHIDTTGQDGIKDYVGGYHGTLGGDASIVSETTLGSDVSSTIHFNTSGRVGIGTSNPATELNVIGNSKLLGNLEIDGKIGIGTATPDANLDVNGTITASGSIKSTSLGAQTNVVMVGVDNALTSSTQMKIDSLGNIAVANDMFVSGNLKTENNISFVDENGTFPTNTAGFFWDLNNDEARIYAKQPASDQIDFVFKLSDNNNSTDRYLFWIDDYRGGSYDRYPLLMHGGEVLFHMTETSEGVPNDSTSKVRIDSSGRIAMQATSDPSTATNYAHIYSKDVASSAEVFVRDEAGNVTQISPHNEEGEWQYFSRNTKTGKVVRVNMEKMIRKLEEITGESFMEEWYEDTE